MQVLKQISSLAAITTSILSNNPAIIIQSTLISKSNLQNYFFALNFRHLYQNYNA